jgi:hypothetical protein
MRTYEDAVGRFATLTVRARGHDAAVRAARLEARAAGLRVIDVTSAVRQWPESRIWRVEVAVR